MARIGFIGLGVMGSRMAKRLLQAGHEVTVYNRTPEKIHPLVQLGAAGVSEIASLVTHAEVICTCLSMPRDVLEVYEGKGGIMDHLRPSTICIDFTTVGLDTSVSLAQKAKEKGGVYLDAPVSGGPEGAEQGTLTIMVGGEQTGSEQVMPILQVLGNNIQYLGSSGSGTVVKLMNQYLVAVHSLAASEVMVTAASLGIQPERLYEILRTSYGDSRILRRHMEQYVFPRNFEPGGALKYVLKDVKLAIQLFEQAGVTARTGNSAEEAFAAAMGEGLADLDMSAVIQLLETQSNVVVKGSDKT